MHRWIALIAIVLLAAAASPANAAWPTQDHEFDGNIVWNNVTAYGTSAGPCSLVTGGTFTAQQLATVYFTNNRQVNPLLSTYVDSLANPRWDPQYGSPAIGGFPNSAIVNYPDPWFDVVCYAGGVPPRDPATPNEDWTTGWTYYSTQGGLGRTDINYGKPLIILQGVQAVSLNLVNTNNYLLRGRVQIPEGRSITIQEGTVIFGEFATIGFLEIDRGGQIFSNGTRTNPIIFTSERAPGSMAPGDFGGIVINGRAIANCANTAAGDSCASEGGNAGYYGGNDDNDNSGSITYTRIEYAGHEVVPNNELNCLTMNGVGRNTLFDYIECMAGSDDTFEWFGGTARCKHLVSVGGQDDNLDWQMGYRGFIQHFVCKQWPKYGTGVPDRGIEADDNEFNHDAQPRSNPCIANATFVGGRKLTPPVGGQGVELRRGTSSHIINSIIMDFNNTGLRLTDPQTFRVCVDSPAGLRTCVYPVSVEDEAPVAGQLAAAVGPVPAAGLARIAFTMPAAGNVRIQVFDIKGRLVDTLSDGYREAGSHAVVWQPGGRSAGTYFYRVSALGQERAGKIVVVK
jgi:hypothetical protein